MKSPQQSLLVVFLCVGLGSTFVRAEPGHIQWRSGAVTRTQQTPADIQRHLAALAPNTTGEIHHVVVRFTGPLQAADRRALNRAGIELLRCLGGNAYFAAIDPVAIEAAPRDAFENLVDAFPIERNWKLHPLLLDNQVPTWIRGNVPAGEVAPRAIHNRVVLNVLFHPDVALNTQAVHEVEAIDGVVLSRISVINGLVVDLPEANIGLLTDRDAVQWVEPPLPPLEGVNEQNRALTQAEVAQSPPYNLDGSGVSVLVYDSGAADATHPDFGGRLTVRDLSDVQDHSTHVAGTIGGDGAESGGLHRGMAPGVTLESFGLQVGIEGIFLYSDPGDIERDYRDALSLGVDIANNSIGTNTCGNFFPCEISGDYGVTANLLDAIVRGSLGTPIPSLFAAGNERNHRGDCPTGHCCRCIEEGVHTPEGYRSIAPPAGAKNTLCIGAINSNDDSATYFSSWGPTDDGRLKPDVSAPGCQTDGDLGVTSTVVGGGYGSFCGTSMATPTATGVAALVLEDLRLQFPGAGDPLPSTLKALLVHNAVDIGPVGPDYQTGYGSIRAVDTVDFLRTGSFTESVVEQAGTSGFILEVSGAGALKITLAWDDAPATPNVSNALVNDLDLVVVDPNGVRHYPWTLNPALPSTLAVQTGPDAINNIEQVEVVAPVAGLWTIRVVGTNVPEGPQRFSIASDPQLQTDCDEDGVSDADQIADNPLLDCSGNGVLDVCEPDCNTNGVADSCDIQSGAVEDCDGNEIPDQCELASGAAQDCNGNLQPDVCDVNDGAPDCNANFIPDTCEADCNLNGQPDDCDLAMGSSPDCNGNNLPDECDLGAGTSVDSNMNAIPDECEGPVIFVDANAQGANLGTSWANAYTNLQSALTVASNSALVEQIWVAQGVYRPTQGQDRSAHFRMLSDVALYGGFAGVESSLSERQWNMHKTILSGDIGAVGDAMDNSYHIVVASDVSSTGVLDGFTIADGRATGSAQDEADVGAGVLNIGGSPRINNVIFENNFATGEFPDGGGGAVYNTEQANGTFSNCTFIESESRFGGALYIRSSHPTISRCQFLNGTAVAGAGIHNTSGSSPVIVGCSFIGNNSVQGPAIINELGSHAWIERCVFDDNHADPTNLAGALLNVDSDPTVLDCLFTNNTAGTLGGAVFNLRGSSPTFVHCRFVGNRATNGSARGGAIASQNSAIIVENCLFQENEAVLDGGAVYGVTTDMTIRSSTFNKNATTSGGAVNVLRGSVILENSIFFGDEATNGKEIALVDNSTCTISHSNLEGGSEAVFLFTSSLNVGAGMLDADPQFVETAAFDLLLSQSAAGQAESSACVDAGSGLASDLQLDGRTTRTDGFGDSGVVDMGFHHPLPDCNANGTPDFDDIAAGTSSDCDVFGNGIPDECEPDCDSNGIVDSCEISIGSQRDCDFDLVPDNCAVFVDCDANLVFDACDILDGVHDDCDLNAVPDVCQPDCDGDTLPDACELLPIGPSTDCNSNGIPDECDIDSEQSLDCDLNGQPDECQPDCNNNGIADPCDIASMFDADCNSNGIPDECDIETGQSFDADSNGEPDECGQDCNLNGIADLFDISGGTSTDCDANGLPDECEPDCNANGVTDICDLTGFESQDCDANGVPDECDIAGGASDDCNANGTPDSCELLGGAFLSVFLNPNPGAQQSFTGALAMEAERFIIGSPGDGALAEGAGLAWLYDAETGDVLHTFASPTPVEDEFFGASAAFAAGKIWIGAAGTTGAFEGQGAVYVFDASTYGFEFAVSNPTPAELDQFGGAMIAAGDKVVVTARLDDTAANNAGAVYVFDAQTGGLLRTILDPPGQSSNLFGSSMAIAGGKLVVGVGRDDREAANSGVVHIIDIDTGTTLHTVLNPSPAANDGFGQAVAGLGRKIIVGSPLDDTDGANAGIAYLVDADSGAILNTLHNPSAQPEDQFGREVASAGNRAIVGALLSDGRAFNAGSLIVFDAGTGLAIGSLDNPSPQDNDNFSSSMVGLNDRLLVGAWRDDTAGEDAGAAYLVQLAFDENGNGSPDDCDRCGDLDGDADVDDADLTAFLAAFSAAVGDGAYVRLADLDHDNVVTLVDYQMWLTCYRAYQASVNPALLGDFDADGDVDDLDYTEWLACQAGPGNVPNPTAPKTAQMCLDVFDADSDGDLDMIDFTMIQSGGAPKARERANRR